MDQRTPSGDVLDFGRHNLPASVELLRGLATRLPANRLGLWGVSLIRRLCLAGRTPPFDVSVFDGQRARLYPHDNRCEKRVFAGAQLWDGEEREHLARQIAAHGRDPQSARRPFHFVDAGANVGLYTLSVRASCQAAGIGLKALAIEPDPVNLGRLGFNLAASGASEVSIADVALDARKGELRMTSSGSPNRGELHVSATGETRVTARPLLAVLERHGFQRVDALKMDIEGMEDAVLTRFFADAPAALWPLTIVLETGRGGNAPLLDGLLKAGYHIALQRGINTVLGLTRHEEWNRQHGQA